MAVIYIFAVAVVALVMTPQDVGGQQAEQCTTAATTLMKDCAEGGSISNANFLWYVTNGTSKNGEAPADEAAFKTKICSAEQQIGECIFNQLATLANTTCQGNLAILQTVQSFLVTYDDKCADPCRKSLLNDLRQCFVSSGLSGDLFLSNRTAGHVIGSTQEEADKFCANKDKLLRCMHLLHNNCSDALAILSTQDFHLPSYEQGVNILCSHSDVYLKGLECFATPTPLVDVCLQKSQQSFLQATVEARSKTWTQERFTQATCKITIEQVDCDVKAWDKSEEPSCTDAVVSLRREMECSLLPPNCSELQKSDFEDACHEGVFYSPGGGSGTSRVVALPNALLFVLAFVYPVVKTAVV